MNNTFKLYLLFFVILISGCSTELSNLKPSQYLQKEDQNGIVFGRFLFNIDQNSLFNVHFRNIETQKNYEIIVQDQHSIFNRNAPNKLNHEVCLSLPAGKYEIDKIITVLMDSVTSSHKIDFDVKPGKVTYIGTMTYGWKETNNYILWGKGNVYIDVIDEHDEEVRAQAMTCPNVKDGDYKVDLLQVNDNKISAQKVPI